MPDLTSTDVLLARPYTLTVALCTPQGRGAVATIRVCGDLTLLEQSKSNIPFRAANGRDLLDQPPGRIVFGQWGVAPAEDVVVCRVGPGELEIHCHGGVSAANRILAAWNAAGVVTVAWQDQVARAAGQLVSDCQLAVTQAMTLRTATILIDQEPAWREFAARAIRLAKLGSWDELRTDITTAQEWSSLGCHLLEPFQVVLTGPPNVGKSALLNALVGYQRAVVFDEPGTTRDVVTAETAFDGWPIRLVDTAGLRDEATGLEAAGIQLAHEQIERANLILQVFDATVETRDSATSDARVIEVANKIDLVTDPTSLERPGRVAVSAITGTGLDQLIAAVVRRLVPRVPNTGELVPFHARQIEWLTRMRAAVEARSAPGINEVANEIA